ncbi:RNA-binding protein, partial [Enterococcus faecium]
ILREYKKYIKHELPGLTRPTFSYTGDSYKAEITYITDYMQKSGYVVLGIKGVN